MKESSYGRSHSGSTLETSPGILTSRRLFVRGRWQVWFEQLLALSS